MGKKPIGKIDNARFPYLYKSNDGIILLSAVDYDIYLREYSRFSYILDGQNILDSKTLNGDSNGYKYMWNAGICEIEDGYMMLIESGNKEGQEDVKPTTWISEDLDFSGDEKKNATIEKGGNPWIVNLGSNRILAFHGVISDDGFWKINASIYRNGYWHTAPDEVFCVKESNIHVCDPSILVLGNKTVLSFYYNQRYTLIYDSEILLDEIYDNLASAIE